MVVWELFYRILHGLVVEISMLRIFLGSLRQKKLLQIAVMQQFIVFYKEIVATK